VLLGVFESECVSSMKLIIVGKMIVRFGQTVFLVVTATCFFVSEQVFAARDHGKHNDPFLVYLSNCQKAHVCNGVYLVAHNGKTVFEGAFGNAGDELETNLKTTDRFDIGSISKQFTAAAVLRLVADDRLSLDNKSTSYFPTFPYKDITVQQLLSHTSGIPDVLPYYSSQLRGSPKGAPHYRG
jgi:Beta-lactamase